MSNPIRSLLCRHEFGWSERRQCEVCYRCGATRAVRNEPAYAPVDRNAFVFDVDGDDDLSMPGTPPPFTAVEVPAAEPAPDPEPAGILSGAEALRALRDSGRNRREKLLERLERLAGGGSLDRTETIDVLLAVIEDGQSSDPVLSGADAADWFARLTRARG